MSKLVKEYDKQQLIKKLLTVLESLDYKTGLALVILKKWKQTN